MIRKAAFFLLFLVVLAACSKVEEDSVAPVISSLSVNSEMFLPGEELLVQVSGTDNLELNQVRLRLEENFSKSFGFWKFVEVRDISGTSFSTNFKYIVPDTALAGLYEVSIQIADQRGNGSIDSTIQFVIQQPTESPMIQNFASQPEIGTDGVLRLTGSDTLTFSGVVSDQDSLFSCSVILRDQSGSALGQIEYPVLDTTIYNLSSNPDTIFMELIEQVPSELLIKVEDKVGHQTRQSYAVELD